MSMNRSENMRRIKSKDTSPEVFVRSLAHRMGYRFHLHSKDLPGKPDIIFRTRRKVVFVNGCFWHGHFCNEGSRTPKSNTKYWVDKINRNKERDAKNLAALQSMGWSYLVIWECEIDKRNSEIISRRLTSFLGSTKVNSPVEQEF